MKWEHSSVWFLDAVKEHVHSFGVTEEDCRRWGKMERSDPPWLLLIRRAKRRSCIHLSIHFLLLMQDWILGQQVPRPFPDMFQQGDVKEFSIQWVLDLPWDLHLMEYVLTRCQNHLTCLLSEWRNSDSALRPSLIMKLLCLSLILLLTRGPDNSARLGTLGPQPGASSGVPPAIDRRRCSKVWSEVVASVVQYSYRCWIFWHAIRPMFVFPQ